MKFGQSIENNKKNIFLRKSYKNGAERLVPDLPLFFKNALPPFDFNKALYLL